ncbi:RNA polymerase sigma-70 factor [Parabacteroides gordonii]|jgi:RNA polymerase sigma-70 factor (ECF subfamily)|uniref:RNA polymerase sigma-70 factor n=1 Tax=Parabacteroides gordonii MS-1 = DSM 23371 TaxID=1203610 RepID=A0A0F5IK38_9BACT|nr:RNA polymerase sigma-70 factor [Parabacteroides gordonii]KKB45690.1 RNA polymerase sigma-70 factor [Parabacteroides gordonii MS-1 = DSM 23371]MCA5586340.1 RNA polymerase sigma-70 factor [Parabacteroides gordonii]RGP18581.1 RNA polymerase sigma-70 factor [Parabacteroides gordonii]
MRLRDKTDTDLITLIIHDDEAAFSELYIRYKDKLHYFCLSLLKSEEETNDIVQEIFIRVWESRVFINPDLSFSSFLYTMARNRVLNYFRDMDIDAKAKSILAQNKPVEEDVIESDLIYTEYQNILKEAIEQLSPQRKKVFNMSRMDNLTHKEIAEQLGISVNTVQEHISESLRFIKTYFGKHSDISISVLLYLMM